MTGELPIRNALNGVLRIAPLRGVASPCNICLPKNPRSSTMRLRRLVRYLTASLLFAASSAAIAVPTTTVTDLGVLDANSTTFEQYWFRMFGQGFGGGAFNDRYTFSIQNAGGATGSVIGFDIGTLGLVLDSVTLYKAGETVALASDSSPEDFLFQPLAIGSYVLDVTGDVTVSQAIIDVGGAWYQGTIRSFASPAPEPAALAMGLAGLLAIGSVAAKRRKG